jgi:hypothetical protein
MTPEKWFDTAGIRSNVSESIREAAWGTKRDPQCGLLWNKAGQDLVVRQRSQPAPSLEGGEGAIKVASTPMTTTHEELLDTIKIAVDQLANDQSVPQRQTIRELVDIREYIGSAIDIIRHETTGRTK